MLQEKAKTIQRVAFGGTDIPTPYAPDAKDKHISGDDQVRILIQKTLKIKPIMNAF